MLETLGFIVFILAVLFVALMAPKPSDKGPKPPGSGPSADKPAANQPPNNDSSAKGPDAPAHEKHGADSPGE